jgi:hypothetical protein
VTRSTITTMKALIDHGSGKHAREDKPRTVIQCGEALEPQHFADPAAGGHFNHTDATELSMLKVPMRDRIPLSVCRRDGRARFIFI